MDVSGQVKTPNFAHFKEILNLWAVVRKENEMSEIYCNILGELKLEFKLADS